ncbi:MAG: biotin--[acetyl-CoA-carboxylase] ligase [Treponemataceae bacterium]
MESLGSHNPFGAPIYSFKQVSSTMDEARRVAASGCPNGTVVIADIQEAGRGRIAGRSWRSGRGESLLCTTILRFPSLDSLPSALTLRVGLAAAYAIEDVAPFPVGCVRVKWPNDVLAEQAGTSPSVGKKLCGILCEADGSAVYVGTGFNIAQREFPPEISGKASSIFLETMTEPSRESLLTAFLTRLAGVVLDTSNAWKTQLENRLFRRGERVRFETGMADSGVLIEGILVGIGAAGEVLIRADGDTAAKAFVSGELKVYEGA